MAYIQIPPQPLHTHPELVQELIKELQLRSNIRGKGIPDIIEQELHPYKSAGDWAGALIGIIGMHIIVIWDKWIGLSEEECAAIVNEAYKKIMEDYKGYKVVRITTVSPKEAPYNKLTYNQLHIFDNNPQ